MLKAIVVDDEPIVLDELCTFIKGENIEIAGKYSEPITALNEAIELKPDIAFLDIEIPEINGIELAKKLQILCPSIHIVFVTAYKEYALSAFGVRAIHYLLKPVDKESIKEAIDRVERMQSMITHLGTIDSVYIPKNKINGDRICLQDKEDIIVINLSDVLYLTSQNSITIIVTKNGEYKSRKGLQFWEQYLENYDYIRCHKSYIVNANYIYKMIHVLGEYKELLLNYCDIRLPISRRKVNIVKSWLGII